MSKGNPSHRLLVLGMLRMQDMHGYQLAEVIETHFDDDVHIKKSTMYDTLRRLAEEGLVDSHEEREGNRPPRTVYSLTPLGAQEFADLLKGSVATYDSPFSYGDVGLMFLDVLPDDERDMLLSERRNTLARIAESHGHGSSHGGTMDLAGERIALLLDAEIQWLDDVLARRG